MWKKIFTPEGGGKPKKREDISSWDVIVLSFSLLFQNIQFWIRPNIWMVLISIPLVTLPGAKAGLYQAVSVGLCDPALTYADPRQEMKKGFFKFVWRALGLELLKWFVLAVILTSIWFWIAQDTWVLRSISVISIYGFILWWTTIGYIYPVLIEKPDLNIYQVAKEAAILAFRKPFDSLLFAVISTLLFILGLILLGPILFIIPALRSILHIQGYWFVNGQIIPGFMDIVEYTEKYYD
ncbi:MAG: hypothetical protein PVF83_17735 [Anaerolineales bacterium]|jgi:hypothetical protein